MTKLSNLILMSDSYLKKIGYLLTLRLVSSLSCKKKKFPKLTKCCLFFSPVCRDAWESWILWGPDPGVPGVLLPFRHQGRCKDTGKGAREKTGKVFFFYIYLLILTLLPQQSIYMLTFIRNVQFPHTLFNHTSHQTKQNFSSTSLVSFYM